jgi:2-oxoglutarate ferredoxin oxidoreductase subunit alpha
MQKSQLQVLCGGPAGDPHVSRGGPGIGGIQPGQADYHQATRGGGNGDYKIPVFAPASVQEAVDLIYDAIPLADAWRNPIFIFADGILGQMMEPVRLPEPRPFVKEEEIPARKPWALPNTATTSKSATSSNPCACSPRAEAHVEKLFVKYRQAEN